MAYAIRRTEYQTSTGRTFDDMVLELSAAELRDEIANAKASTPDRKVRIIKISAEQAKHYIFKIGLPHGTGYWHDGERIRHSKPGV